MYMKPPLLLLHGAIGASAQLKPLAQQLNVKFDVHTLDFPGHGGTPFPEIPFSIALFADAVRDYIRTKGLGHPAIFGYSMGGYVAMYLARHFPAMVGNVITLGAKFHWDPDVAARELKMLDPVVIETKVPAFAASLAQLHAPNDWKEVLKRTRFMLEEMGRHNPLQPGDYADVKSPSLLMLGDRDKMAGMEETVNVYKHLPVAQFAVLPGTPHPIEQAPYDLISTLIVRFCTAMEGRE